MQIIAIDPGTHQSAYVQYDGHDVTGFIVPNGELLDHIQRNAPHYDAMACEWIANMGMSVGAEVFETCRWIGRFEQVWHMFGSGKPLHYITRIKVKMHVCGTARAKDANIRQALIDRFGGKDNAIGSKKNPGPLYGVKSHMWSALAVAMTAVHGQF